MDDVPAEHPADRSVSRRGVLIGGGIAALAAAGGGIALGVATAPARGEHPSTASHIPAELAAALAAETALIADVDAALETARPHTRRALREVRSDHVAHLAALRAAIADDLYPLTAPSASASGAASSPSSSATASAPRPDVRAAELRASRAASARAARLSGRDAALLASIAASEASHAELLA